MVTGSHPLKVGFFKMCLNTRQWRNGPPMVFAFRVKDTVIVGMDRGIEANFTFYARGKGNGDFIDLDDETIPFPCHMRRANLEVRCCTVKAFMATFRHRPAMAGFAIKPDIEGAKIFWICPAKTTGQGVIRREDTAHESYNGEAVFFIIA